MKKTSILFSGLLVLCMSLALTGCGSKGGESGSKTESKAESKTESKAESKIENKTEDKTESGTQGSGSTYECPGTGFGFDLPEGVKIEKGFLHIRDLGDVDYDSGVMMGWPVYYSITREEYEKLTDETVKDVNPGFSFSILCVEDVKSEAEAKEKIFALIEKMMGKISPEERERYSSLKVAHQEGDRIWLYEIVDKVDDVLPESGREEYSAFYDASEKIISSMKFYPPETWKGTEEGADLSFDTIDVNGNPVNSRSLFAQNKVTMINIWATSCGPCINELPELEEMNREFREKGGAVVGLLDDVWVDNMKYLDEAQAIIKDTGVTYTNLCAWDGYDEVLEAVGTPTTYFVDSNGKLIGEPILGAHTDKYRERMEKYLESAK